MKQIIEIYKQYIDAKTKALEAEIKTDPELESKYKELQFTEKVINGHASIVGKDISPEAKAAAAISIRGISPVTTYMMTSLFCNLISLIFCLIFFNSILPDP